MGKRNIDRKYKVCEMARGMKIKDEYMDRSVDVLTNNS